MIHELNVRPAENAPPGYWGFYPVMEDLYGGKAYLKEKYEEALPLLSKEIERLQ